MAGMAEQIELQKAVDESELFAANCEADYPGAAAVIRGLCALLLTRESRKWQPIKTAPKDTELLASYPKKAWRHGMVVVAKFDVHLQQWLTVPGRYDKGEPTHWMPLPDPPSAAARAAGERP